MNLGENLEKSLENIGESLAIAQDRFVNSQLYDVFNSALDFGIRVALPEFAEDVVIDIKDTLLENGFKDGAKQIWNNIKDIGQSAFGIVSGNFKSIEQIQDVTKSGGVLDLVSKIFDYTLDKAVEKEKISKSTKNSIKSQKNSIVTDIKNKVSNDLDNQVKYVEKIQEFSDKWKSCFEKEDLNGMKNANRNIKKYLEKTFPLEEVIKNARKIEIMHNLVENTGSFDITEEEKELASALAY